MDRAHLSAVLALPRRASKVCAAGMLLVWLVGDSLAAGAQVTIVREPVFSFDARALIGAGRIMARTRFHRAGSSTIPRELARMAGKHDPAAAEQYRQFLAGRLQAFLHDSVPAGIRTDDAGDARALFVQVAFRIFDGQGFSGSGNAIGAGLSGQGAIAGMAASSASLARLEFILRVRYVMGKNARFASLTDTAKQRVYDFYALAGVLLAEADAAAIASGDSAALSYVRKQAERQLRGDLGVDPRRVRFTAAGLEVR